MSIPPSASAASTLSALSTADSTFSTAASNAAPIQAPTASPVGGRSFASPAMIRILLAPAHPDLDPAEFERWASVVRGLDVIKISDLPRKKKVLTPGSPLARAGEVHLSFVTSYDPSHSFLAPFSLHRQVLGVLGLGTYSTTSAATREVLERSPTILRSLHPNAVVHRVFAFDTAASRPPTRDFSGASTPDANPTSPPASTSSAGFGGRSSSGLVVFPAVRRDLKDVRFYLRTLIPDFVASLLDALDTIVDGLEGTPLETPRETLEGISAAASAASSSSARSSVVSPGGSTTSSAGTSSAASSAASRASGFFSSFSSKSSAVGGGLQPGSDALRSSSPASDSSASSSKKSRRMTTTATGPTGLGRYAKVKADLALLSGDLWAALREYETCIQALGKERALAGGQDAVWYAGALEGWAVARTLVRRMGGLVEERAPALSLLYPSGQKEKSTKDTTPEFPFIKQPWGEIAEVYALAITIYTKCLAPPSVVLDTLRAMTNETPRDHTHPLIHASACIAYARFLLAVWASGGWNGEAFDQLLYGGVPPALAEAEKPGYSLYAQHTTASGISRHDIASAASQALTQSIIVLKPPDQIWVLSSLASVFGCIGFSRREAYLLRQLQSVVVSLLARAMMSAGRQQQQQHERGGSLANAPAVVSLDSDLDAVVQEQPLKGTMLSQVDAPGAGEGADAVLALTAQVCEVLGINLDVSPVSGIPSNHILARAGVVGSGSGAQTPTEQRRIKRASWGASAVLNAAPAAASDLGEDDQRILLQDEAPFGWSEQQITLLKDTISVCEMLSDHVGIAFFAALLLRDFHWRLAPEEQWRLAQGLQRVATTIRWNVAQDFKVLYWGPAEPVVSIEAVPVPLHLVPREHPPRDLAAGSAQASASSSVSMSAAGNPFFWNPKTGGAAGKSAALTLVEEEPCEFLVTLQNPFDVPLELESVSLDAEGDAEFEAEPASNVVLPASSYHTLRLRGTPSKVGTFAVKGCHITLLGCAPKRFPVAIPTAGTEDKASIARATEMDDRRTRLKATGLDARPLIAAQRRAALKTSKSSRKAPTSISEQRIQCNVVPTQPLLVAEASSATAGSMVLFEGETTVFRVRLRNVGDLPVDFMRVGVTDDLTDAARGALAEGKLLPADAYWIETDLAEKPVLSYDVAPRDPRHEIQAGAARWLSVRIRGKLDCSCVSLVLSYAHIDGPGRGGLQIETPCNFFTRQLLVQASVSVLPIVDCGPLSVRPLRSEADDYCLVSFDVRNLHSHAVTVAFDVRTADGPGAKVEPIRRTLDSGMTAKVVLPMARIRMSPEQLSRAIPVLTERQFVVSRVALSDAQQAAARATFWTWKALRERLLEGGPKWVDPVTGREGEIDVSSLALTEEQARVIQWDPLAVQLEVGERGEGLGEDEINEALLSGARGAEAEGQVEVVAAEQFICIRERIKNRSDRPLRLLRRLVPLPSTNLERSSQSAYSLDGMPRKLEHPALTAAGLQSSDATLANVVLTNTNLAGAVQEWPLEPGREATVETTLCLMSRGDFAFTCAVEEDWSGLEAGAARLRAFAPAPLILRAI